MGSTGGRLESKWSPRWVAALLGVILLFVFFTSLFTRLKTWLVPFLGMDALMAKETREARVKLASAKDDFDKCDPLSQISKDDFNRGNIPEARRYATELLAIADKSRAKYGNDSRSDYGVAIHDGNMVLGRIALRENRREDAKRYLLKAGLTPGAPTLDSFGPNMSLANDLLEAGERATVLQYLHECHRFWGFQADKLNSWEETVKDGGTPDFSGNFYY